MERNERQERMIIDMKNIISIKSIRKEFRGKIALENINLNVEEGEIFGFLGPSGAGKTTAIKIMTSQLIQTSGIVELFGKDVIKNKDYIFENIGILSDMSGLYERLTVLDNLMLFAKLYKVDKGRVLEVLQKVDMEDSHNKPVKQLSKGMKQRVRIARAVIHRPKLLFLDEPTSALDPGTVLKIHNIIRELNKSGTTVFLTTHNMEEADKLCDRVAFLNDGNIVELGEPNQLKLKYKKEKIKVVLKNEEEKLIDNNEVGGMALSEWMRMGELLSIHSLEPTLEDIFLDLTGRKL